MAKTSQPSQAMAARVRHLLADGYRWAVYEVAAPQFDRRGGTHLVFDGELIMRRVRVYPTGWFELPDEELYALSLDVRIEKDRPT
jgi:hypothetical protein